MCRAIDEDIILYAPYGDSHPVANGYKIYATAAFRLIKARNFLKTISDYYKRMIMICLSLIVENLANIQTGGVM